jgi:SAM-dependent methyltransferase
VTQHLAGARRVLDVGCGEGQVARHVARTVSGSTVVGVDPADAQLQVARERGGGVAYLRGRADALPVRTGAFDAAVACLVFEHITEMDAAIAEVARCLAPGGVFLFLLNHPLLQSPGSGWIDDQVLGEEYWRIGPYLTEDVSLEEIAPGVTLPFVHRPLSRYVNTLRDVGLVVERMEEPAPPPGFLALAPEYQAAATIPRLLALRTRRVT